MSYTPPILTSKVCCACKVDKPVAEFGTKFRKASRRPRYICKSCESIRAKKKYESNRENILKRGREWYRNNRDSRNAAAKKWRDGNRARVNAAIRKNVKKRYREDPGFRLKCILRARVFEAIKTGEGCKRGGTRHLIGADWIFVRDHLQGQFHDGMTWDNHGAHWHIDHHIPCSAWDLTNDHHQRACFNWRNMRPLVKLTNWKKNDLLPEGWQDYMAMLLEATRKPHVVPLQQAQ